jgi:hypothetical protein
MNNNEETKDIINDTLIKENYEMASSTDELENFDFSTEKEFDIEGYHELVETLKDNTEDDSMKELVKLREAKNIIEKTAKEFLDPDFVDKYTQEERNLMNMIKKFDPNLDEVKKLTEKQKDKIYDIAQYLFNGFQKKLNELTFIFPLTYDERKFIFNVFNNKLEYDQNEVFQLKDLKDNYLDIDFKQNENKEYITYINVNDIIIFYHLIAKYKVKGINKDHYEYLQVLTKIGERIKLFNAYNVIVQRLSNDFKIWGGALSIDGDLVGKSEPEINSEDEIVVVNEEAGEVIK